MSVFGMKSKGGERLLRRRADGFDEERREPSCSCGIGMKRRYAKLQSDAQRLRQRHPPSVSLKRPGGGERGGGGGGGGNGGAGEGEASCARD